MAKIISELNKGVWSLSVNYTLGDMVSSDGSSYICIANNINQAPPNAIYWALLASKGSTGSVGPAGPIGPSGTGATVDTDGTLAANSDIKVASQKATKTYADTAIAAIPVAPLDGWLSAPDTFVYVSANSFKITGVDKTTTYTKGTRIKFTNNGVTVYGVIISSVFSTDTTITLAPTTDYSINNSAITVPFYSYEVNPQGYPGWFNYTPTWAGFSSDPTGVTSRFAITGRTCFVEVSCTGNGTSNSITTTITLPANAATSLFVGGIVRYNDNSSTSPTPGIIILTSASNVADLRKDFQAAVWTNSGAKNANFFLIYEI